MTYVPQRFWLPEDFKEAMRKLPVSLGYNGLGEITMLRTYSRNDTGVQETWHDITFRCIEGIFSIRKSHYMREGLPWNDEEHLGLAMNMALFMFESKWLPPGRALWVMGTPYIYERGAAALQNCGYVSVDKLSEAVPWTIDMLMCGVGIGFDTYSLKQTNYYMPSEQYNTYTFTIPDSREGWVESVKLLLESYEEPDKGVVTFDYSKIRGAGEPIRGFGGTASGPDPLIKLHRRIRSYMQKLVFQEATPTRTITDIMNAVGACVVAGNVRRSAEIAIGNITDEEFLNLKNLSLYPEREDIAWMSNNSVVVRNEGDLKYLPKVAERIISNGEPGVINLMNVQKYGRFGEEMPDAAVGFNPCGEQPLESYELCNLVEVFPSRCENEQEVFEAIRYATFFSSTVSLMMTHSEKTNEVLSRNRRIGVSMSGIADYLGAYGERKLKHIMQNGYMLVRKENARLNTEANIPVAVRVTTVKPSGTISLLAGVSPGMHWPTFKYAIRRMRIAKDSPLVEPLKEAGYPWEVDVKSDNTLVFEFPIEQSASEPAAEVSVHRQAMMLKKYAEWWSDNAVSCTLYFNPKTEDHQVLGVLESTVPFVKSLSMLPHTDVGAYPQMPYEGITKEQYEQKLADLKPMNLLQFINAGTSKGEDTRFCTNEVCSI